MATILNFFDMSVSVQAPGGYLEQLPVTLGPNWQPNDLRIVFITCSGAATDGVGLEMPMTSDPPTGFTAAYSLNPGYETHGVYYRRLRSGDVDNVSIAWPKPSQWQHFMFGLLTARGVDPASTPTAGWLRINQTSGDTVAVANSLTVPGPGVMIALAGSVPTPWPASGAPAWPVSLGVPTGWTGLVATDKSGVSFYPYANDPSLVIVAQRFAGAGTTGPISFPTSKGAPAFNGLYLFLSGAADMSVTLSAA